jgi:NhaP-type Na+/H+ or K+/H+ antiporter
MVAGTAIAFGALGAIAASMKDFIHGNAEFSFSYKTIVGFAVGAALGLAMWSIVKRMQR